MRIGLRWGLPATGLLVGAVLQVAGAGGWLFAAGVVAVSASLLWSIFLVWRRLRGRKTSHTLHETADEEASTPAARARHKSAPSEPDDLVSEMLWQQRYALLLRPQILANLTDKQQAKAQEAMEENMSLVPEGDVFMSQPDDRDEGDRPMKAGGRLVRVEAALLDRYPVTNHQFKQFIDAGGYEEMALWDANIWPAVFGFVDTTGHAGPRFWKNGAYPRGEDDHPVVGVSWHEANAYARWVGKRLPTDPEWVKAGCWPMPTPRGLPKQRRYPWGEGWEPDRANIWSSGLGHTCPVTGFEEGASVAGVYGLIGNVWEWTTDSFGLWHTQSKGSQQGDALKSIRGGAFDTYFESQANCQFQSGDSPLARKHNIGFRCAIGLCDLRASAPLTEPDEEEAPFEQDLVCEEV